MRWKVAGEKSQKLSAEWEWEWISQLTYKARGERTTKKMPKFKIKPGERPSTRLNFHRDIITSTTLGMTRNFVSDIQLCLWETTEETSQHWSFHSNLVLIDSGLTAF
jgi:hypothetical protein